MPQSIVYSGKEKKWGFMKNKIIITGAAGFIASCVASELSNEESLDLVLVDEFSHPEKKRNYEKLKNVFDWVKGKEKEIGFFIHLGARTDTAEQDQAIFDKLNLGYSKKVWQLCAQNDIPLIYASSAATYGDGELGFSDDHTLVSRLSPLNPYGHSKNDFDLWVLRQTTTPPFWAGLKFFNVFGPNEYHKGRMASVIFHAFNQIRDTGKLRLFRSHHPDYNNGGQMRDFIYVKDVLKVIRWMMCERQEGGPEFCGIFNLGTGKARTFESLGRAVFHSLGLEPEIEYIDTPIDIREAYQYFTEAENAKLRLAGYGESFFELEYAIQDYVANFLLSGKTI